METVLAAPAADSGLKPVRGENTHWLIQVMRMRRGQQAQYERLRRQYGELAVINFFGKQMVFAQSPEAAETVLVNADRAFANGPAWEFFIGPFFQRGIMLLDFDDHHTHRRIMQRAFGRQQLEQYLSAMMPSIAREIATWEPGPEFTLQDHFKQLTLDLALDVFVGIHLDRAERNRLNNALIATVQAGSSIVRLPVPGLGWHRGLQGRKVLEEFFYKHVASKRRDPGTDLFSTLCQVTDDDGTKFSDADVVNHMIFVLMAAHDTTTTTMTTMAYYLARYPQWQERARQEAASIPDLPSYAELDTLHALDWSTKESLRLCPPVPILPRITVKDTAVLGHHLPAGTRVIVPLFANHFRPDVWPNPEAFDPERFSPERREDKVHRLAWEPFGGGVHKCIGLYFAGMQIKAIYRQLLTDFEWSVDPHYRWPLDLRGLPNVKDGLPVHLRRIGGS
jgi:cytochrome P450